MFFNRTTAARLREEVGDGFIPIVELYLQRLPEVLETMERAIRDRDARTLERTAHNLKGGSRHLGLETLVERSQTIEDHAFHKRIDADTQTLFDALKRCIPEARRQMETLLADSQPAEKR